jgi:hypothetical protein
MSGLGLSSFALPGEAGPVIAGVAPPGGASAARADSSRSVAPPPSALSVMRSAMPFVGALDGAAQRNRHGLLLRSSWPDSARRAGNQNVGLARVGVGVPGRSP